MRSGVYVVEVDLMDFGQRLAGFRKEKGFTQQALAELINAHVIQLRRYEADAS